MTSCSRVFQIKQKYTSVGHKEFMETNTQMQDCRLPSFCCVCVKKEDFWSQALWNPMRDCSNVSENNSVSCFDLSNNNKNSLWLKASLKNFYSLSKHNRGNNTAEWNLAMQKEPGIPCSSCWLEGSIHICSFTGIFQDFVMGLLHLAFHNYPTEKTTSYRRKQNEAFAGASLLE